MKLEILTLNLWHGGRLMDGVLDFLANQDADILCLQEVYNGTDSGLEARLRSVEVLQARLNYPACEFTPAIVDKFREGKAACGNAILTRFPIQPHATRFFNEPLTERDPYIPETAASVSVLPRILQHVTADTPEGELDIFNVHGVWDLAGDDFSSRRQNMRDIILQAIDGKRNVILAGDTNAQPTNKLWISIEERLHSAFGQELPSTFNMKHKQNPGYATARVDMMFVSPHITVLRRQCHQVDVSDHLPLTATLEFEAPQA